MALLVIITKASCPVTAILEYWASGLLLDLLATDAELGS